MGYIADGSMDRRSGDGIKSIANIMNKKPKTISFGEVETNPSLSNISSEGNVITGSIPSPF